MGGIRLARLVALAAIVAVVLDRRCFVVIDRQESAAFGRDYQRHVVVGCCCWTSDEASDRGG